TQEQMLEVAAIQSLTQTQVVKSGWTEPPFRTPHHTASAVALVGGGSLLQPGEISLAHHGVLFLDELTEFNPRVLDVLREPLEAGFIRIARARYRAELPARFLLVCASNPCFCGHLGDSGRLCSCTPEKLRQYQQRISGPLLDRIDLHVNVPRLPEADKAALLRRGSSGSSSEQLRTRVVSCRMLQEARNGKPNSQLRQEELAEHCALDRSDTRVLNDAVTKLQLSTRAFFRILKIARTIADLAEAPRIATSHLLEAINYRRL
ncbi:MAG TPA: ATP-binding protein, partial [Candidatus Acidoferrum sp.]|nr:ATP-binding protein [Candidatus Acidoferrum sp.]